VRLLFLPRCRGQAVSSWPRPRPAWDGAGMGRVRERDGKAADVQPAGARVPFLPCRNDARELQQR